MWKCDGIVCSSDRKSLFITDRYGRRIRRLINSKRGRWKQCWKRKVTAHSIMGGERMRVFLSPAKNWRGINLLDLSDLPQYRLTLSCGLLIMIRFDDLMWRADQSLHRFLPFDDSSSDQPTGISCTPSGHVLVVNSSGSEFGVGSTVGLVESNRSKPLTALTLQRIGSKPNTFRSSKVRRIWRWI